VNCAADDTASFRLAKMLHVGSNKKSRRFRSLSKAFHKERYAKVEVMCSSPVNRSKSKGVIVARIAPSIVWLVCACQGCPSQIRALRASFFVLAAPP
jgi:hypothetical protein